MAVNIVQTDNQTLGIQNANDAVSELVIGGPTTPTVAIPRFRAVNIMQVPLTASDTSNGGMVTWQNTNTTAYFASPIAVTTVEVDITTKATSSCAMSIGQATSAVISSNLVDTLDVATASGFFDNVTDKGSGGKSRVKVKVNEYITATKITGSVGGLVGNLYVHFYKLS